MVENAMCLGPAASDTGRGKNTIRLRISEKPVLKTKCRIEVTRKSQRKPKIGDCVGRAPRLPGVRPQRLRRARREHSRGTIELPDSLDSLPKLRRLKDTALSGKLPQEAQRRSRFAVENGLWPTLKSSNASPVSTSIFIIRCRPKAGVELTSCFNFAEPIW